MLLRDHHAPKDVLTRWMDRGLGWFVAGYGPYRRLYGAEDVFTMLGFARSLGDFGVTLMVAGDIPGYTQTASLAVYDAVQAGRETDALSLIVPLSGIALAVLYVVGRLQDPGNEPR